MDIYVFIHTSVDVPKVSIIRDTLQLDKRHFFFVQLEIHGPFRRRDDRHAVTRRIEPRNHLLTGTIDRKSSDQRKSLFPVLGFIFFGEGGRSTARSRRIRIPIGDVIRGKLGIEPEHDHVYCFKVDGILRNFLFRIDMFRNCIRIEPGLLVIFDGTLGNLYVSYGIISKNAAVKGRFDVLRLVDDEQGCFINLIALVIQIFGISRRFLFERIFGNVFAVHVFGGSRKHKGILFLFVRKSYDYAAESRIFRRIEPFNRRISVFIGHPI